MSEANFEQRGQHNNNLSDDQAAAIQRNAAEAARVAVQDQKRRDSRTQNSRIVVEDGLRKLVVGQQKGQTDSSHQETKQQKGH